ncbi:hypothetical protein QVE09_25510 [Paenibacillus sp. ClWae2A]|uniref:hypothetical protein n=1 Tax=Paenibacillus sp. ClWae2A TaxID=3057177 RepID=UPI0028F5897E|nr:hypothetical protein [Paenibacillus sp. ClWae2A]MDT9722272.1 hypothetical protein [Paenibacillus sp. ClWae2A]
MESELNSYATYLEEFQNSLYNLSTIGKDQEGKPFTYPHNFCNFASVITLYALLSKDKTFFSQFRIQRINVFFGGEECKHWLIVHSEDGKLFKLEKPVIDMTIHQFDENIKPGIFMQYPLEHKVVRDDSNHIETLIYIMEQSGHPPNIDDEIINIFREITQKKIPFLNW